MHQLRCRLLHEHHRANYSDSDVWWNKVWLRLLSIVWRDVGYYFRRAGKLRRFCRLLVAPVSVAGR